MEATSFLETSVTVHQSTRLQIPGNMNLYQNCCETLKSPTRVEN